MLININCLNKNDSKYKCDMCTKGISSQNRYIVYIAEGYKTSTKKWDLCLKCYKNLSKAIIKYRNKKEEQKK